MNGDSVALPRIINSVPGLPDLYFHLVHTTKLRQKQLTSPNPTAKPPFTQQLYLVHPGYIPDAMSSSLSRPPNTYDDEHQAFANSRSSDFVFIANKQPEEEDSGLLTLEQHADTSDADVKLPLVVLGERGSGKSARLASWYTRRMQVSPFSNNLELLMPPFNLCPLLPPFGVFL